MPGYCDSRSFSASRSVEPSAWTTASPPACFRRICGSLTFTGISLRLPSSVRRHAMLGLGRRLPGSQAAECLVVDELGDGGVLAADRAVRVPAHLDDREVHLERVEDQEPTDQRIADVGDQLDRLRRLDA